MKKFVVSMCTTAVLMGSGLAGTALANNHSDSKWNVTLPSFNRNVYTTSRLKTDKSRSYAKLNQIGVGKANVWALKANGAKISNPKYPLKQGQSVKMYNRAYEEYGRVNIKLAIEERTTKPVRVHAKGVWSPDSI
ncbi:hypothetical protein ACLJJ6_09740 [Pediococcus siamensis]|uniref:hypothetical protein n=1 Tax=Pediococcus siamensis TaxID=381829 RepID=UPI0039A038AC